MKTIILSLTVVALFALASCQKNDDRVPVDQEERVNPNPNTQEICEDSINDTWEAEDSDAPLKSSSSIMNASNANQIPSQFLKIDPSYKLNYNFIVQPDKTSCSWTSYVTAVGAIARGNGYSYSSSSSKIYAVKSKCLTLSNQNLDGAKSITTLKAFANQYDKQYVYARTISKFDTPSDRFLVVKEMLNHLYSYHAPFVVLSTFYYNGGRKSGHYLVVLSIDWKQGGNGSTVYYTDCGYGGHGVDLQDNLRSMNFTSFLDRMVDSSVKYNALFLQPN
jgi:hypothetical protein